MEMLIRDRDSAQQAIDAIKAAYKDGEHVMTLWPFPLPTAAQKTKASILIKEIAKSEGFDDVRDLKTYFLMKYFGSVYAEQDGEDVEVVRTGLTDLSKDELSYLIDRLEQFKAEAGI